MQSFMRLWKERSQEDVWKKEIFLGREVTLGAKQPIEPSPEPQRDVGA